MMIEKAIDVATQWAVFEPNDVLTRAKLHLVLTSFLLSLWQRGALMGARRRKPSSSNATRKTTRPPSASRGVCWQWSASHLRVPLSSSFCGLDARTTNSKSLKRQPSLHGPGGF